MNYSTLPDFNGSAIIAPEIDMIIINATNISPHGLLEWGWMHTVKVAVFSPIVFFAIFGNFLALFAFITRYGQMKSPTHFFIANLALADFLVGILCLPFLAVNSVTDMWYFGKKFCFAYIIMHFWFCSCSIYSTCAICVERYIGVRYPLTHKKIMSTARVLCIILFIWIYGGIVTFISVFFWPEDDKAPHTNSDECASASQVEKYECKSNKRLGHVVFSTVFILYIPVVIMIILYTRIYMIATKHLKVLKQTGSTYSRRTRGSSRKSGVFPLQDADSGVSTTTVVTIDSISMDCGSVNDSNHSVGEVGGDGGDEKIMVPNNTNKWFPSIRRLQLPLTLYEPSSHDSTERLVTATSSKKHIYLAKKLVLLVGILLISYVPYYTVFLIRAIQPEMASLQLFNILKWVRYLNSAMNPFLYAFAVPAYRKAFVNIVVRRKLFN